VRRFRCNTSVILAGQTSYESNATLKSDPPIKQFSAMINGDH
jgi:hypothetical protein